jgi:uncharacterized protein YkwD
LLAEAVNGVRTRNTFVFVAYAGHEDTQAGMSWYLNRLGDEQRKKIRAVINVESIGRAGAIYQVTSRNASLAKLLPKAAFFAKTQPPIDGLEIEKTALKATEQAGLPAIAISSFAERVDAHESSSGDFGPMGTTATAGHSMTKFRIPLTKLDFKSYYETYNMLCVYLLYLDQTLGLDLAHAAEELALADVPEESFGGAAERQVLGLVNDERRSKGLDPLEADKLLTRTARAHSSLIAKEKSTAARMFSDAEEVKTRFGLAGVRCIRGSELVAVVREVDDGPERLSDEYSRLADRKDILDRSHSVIGVGAVKADGNLYVTMDFATKSEFERKRLLLTDESATKYLIEQIAARRKEAKRAPVFIAMSPRLRDTLCDMARTNDQSTYRIRSLAIRRAEVYVAYGPDSLLLPEQMRVLATTDASLIQVAVCDAETSYWVAAIVNH